MKVLLVSIGAGENHRARLIFCDEDDKKHDVISMTKYTFKNECCREVVENVLDRTFWRITTKTEKIAYKYSTFMEESFTCLMKSLDEKSSLIGHVLRDDAELVQKSLEDGDMLAHEMLGDVLRHDSVEIVKLFCEYGYEWSLHDVNMARKNSFGDVLNYYEKIALVGSFHDYESLLMLGDMDMLNYKYVNDDDDLGKSYWTIAAISGKDASMEFLNEKKCPGYEKYYPMWKKCIVIDPNQKFVDHIIKERPAWFIANTGVRRSIIREKFKKIIGTDIVNEENLRFRLAHKYRRTPDDHEWVLRSISDLK